MVVTSIFILFLGSFSWAQVTPFDFIEASRKANEAQRTLSRLNAKQYYGEKCETLSSSTGEAVATCTLRAEDYNTPILKIDYAPNEIPLVIKNQLPVNLDVRLHWKPEGQEG